MDLQDPKCSRWQHHGIQGKIRSTRLLIERRHRLRRDICISDEVHFHYIHTYMYWMEDTSADIKITFLNDVVKEEVYVEQPLGVETHDSSCVQIKEGLVRAQKAPMG